MQTPQQASAQSSPQVRRPTPPEHRRVVIVTGAGTGIGRATAREFAGLGARVVAVGRRNGPLRETADGHPGIDVLAADITAPASAGEIAAEVLRRHGRLDVLVNNAAVVRSGRLDELAEDSLGPQLATNLTAPVLLARAVLPALTEARGTIVNVTTSVGQRGFPGGSVYAATKAALESLTRSWAVELASAAIRVNAVAPGGTDTPIGDHQGLSAERRAAIRARQVSGTPLGRIGRPEEIARAITWLAAPESAYITGVVLPVDGGTVVG